MKFKDILTHLPYDVPFLFVDALAQVHVDGVEGSYRFRKEADFYRGHFKGQAVTPGVLLTECCAQIGLVCLGIYLLKQQQTSFAGLQLGMSSSEMEFLLPVYPGERVVVSSEKVYFRFNKLKCKVKMHNEAGLLVCKGVLSGMIKAGQHG